MLFYFFGHGGTVDGTANTPFAGVNVYEKSGYILNSGTVGVVPADVKGAIGNNTYDLVFLSGCLSADPREGSATKGFIAAFNTKCYLGWDAEMLAGTAASVSEAFWKSLDDENTIAQAKAAVVQLKPFAGQHLSIEKGGDVVIDLTPKKKE
ncbi:MAG: hypothetical protein V1899_10325 [Planctomycetota bacterium]